MISLEEAKQLQNETKLEATQLLESTKITQLLQNFGQVELEGAYSYDLMVKKDIDIRVVNDQISKEQIGRLNAQINELPNIESTRIIDETSTNRREGAPQGWYIACDARFNDHVWKLDVWVMKEVIRDNYPEVIRDPNWIEKCSQEEKDAILLIKAQLFEEQGDYTGANVYRAVLEGGVRDLEGFKKWRSENQDLLMH